MSVTFRGAGHIGPRALLGYHTRWPSASMSISPEGLEFYLWPVTYRFDRPSIVGLTRKKILWSTYLRIVHRIPTYERWVLFLPTVGIQQLEAALSQYGYRVEEASAVPEQTDVEFRGGVLTIAWVGFALAVVAGIAGVAAAFYAVSR